MDASALVAEFRAELPWHLRCSEKTAQISADHVRLYLANQPDPFPHCLTYPRVVAWLQHLAVTPPRRRDKALREPSTVNGHLKSLKRLSRWAVARGFLNSDPVATLRGLAEADRVIVAPSLETVGLVLLASLDHGDSQEIKARNHAIVCALIDIGPRAGELVAMSMDDVMEQGASQSVRGAGGGDVAGALPSQYAVRDHAVIHGKGNRDRLVAVNPMLRLALEAYLPLRRARMGERALFVSEDGVRMTYVALRGVLQRICVRAGVAVALHDFRRFALTEMWLMEIGEVSGMLLSGHRNSKVFQRYVRGGMAVRALADHRARSPLRAVAGP